jgi:peptide/nickel transport system permease protein
MKMAQIHKAQPAKLKKESQFMVVVKRIIRNPTAAAGFIIFLALVLLAIFAPILTPYNYTQMDMKSIFLGPSLTHPCGTDNLGRDIFTRLIYGGRYSLSMGFISMLAAATGGVIIGALCGFFLGKFDFAVMRFLDIFQAIPGMLLTIAISAALGAGFDKTIFALAIARVPAIARITRGSVMQVRQNEFIEAAEAIGCSHFRRIFLHVLPNSLAPVIVEITMGIANTVLTLSSLSYIGLGIQPPIPEWGAMLSAARGYIRTYPYMILFPGLFIATTVLSLNLAGDGLRDALDPKLKM